MEPVLIEPSASPAAIAAAPTEASGPGAPIESSAAELDRALAELGEQARSFARMPVADKARLLRELVPRFAETAAVQVELACRAKGIDPASAQAGEEWLSGPYVTLGVLRRLAESLEEVARRGRPSLPSLRQRRDGRIEARVHPQALVDRLLFAGSSASVLFELGATREDVRAAQARVYQEAEPQGGVSLVLGAGNVASIPATDTLHKLFAEGRVVLLKMNPVNAYLGPALAEAFAPLVARGLLRIVYGGADVGRYLCAHAAVTDIHITGSDATHDLIVWGPPGAERDARKAVNQPILDKPITSELGNVSPLLIVPSLYDRGDLRQMARSVVTQVVNNASFNCNATKMLVVADGWPQRSLFLDLVAAAFAAAPPRRAYHPGAFERYRRLTDGRPVRVHAPLPAGADDGAIPWTLVPGLDPRDGAEPLFRTEPFCGLLSEVAVGSDDRAAFLDAAVRFCNDRLWGTLSAGIVIDPHAEEDPEVVAALDRAVVDLRYGAVAVNHWPAVAYAMAVPPWGGHPSSTLADVQSGMGFVHNTLLLGRVEKTVLRGPLRSVPESPTTYDNEGMRRTAERLVRHEADPGLGSALGVVWSALRR